MPVLELQKLLQKAAILFWAHYLREALFLNP